MVMLMRAVPRSQCDGAFLQKAQANNLQDGTTACTVFIGGTDLFCANVGDSEALIVQMVGGAPRGKKIAQIHKPEQKSEADRIRQLGGEVFAGHLLLLILSDSLPPSLPLPPAPRLCARAPASPHVHPSACQLAAFSSKDLRALYALLDRGACAGGADERGSARQQEPVGFARHRRRRGAWPLAASSPPVHSAVALGCQLLFSLIALLRGQRPLPLQLRKQ